MQNDGSRHGRTPARRPQLPESVERRGAGGGPDGLGMDALYHYDALAQQVKHPKGHPARWEAIAQQTIVLLDEQDKVLGAWGRFSPEEARWLRGQDWFLVIGPHASWREAMRAMLDVLWGADAAVATVEMMLPTRTVTCRYTLTRLPLSDCWLLSFTQMPPFDSPRKPR